MTVGRASRVDTHLHLSQWWPDLAHTAYRADIDYTVKGLLGEMDASRIDFGLVIQVFESPNPKDALTESRTLYDASGGRLRPVVKVDPTLGEEAGTETRSPSGRLRSTLRASSSFPAMPPSIPTTRGSRRSTSSPTDDSCPSSCTRGIRSTGRGS